MDWLLTLFGVSLGLTLVIELIVALLFGLRRRDDLILVVLVNILTNPAAVWLHWAAGIPQIPIEVVVVLVEFYVYRQFKVKNPLGLSCAANGISWTLGLILQML